MTTSTYTVGALAKATDTKAVTIRYYEQSGLLPSAGRSPSGYRFYTDAERNRLLLGLADRRDASCSGVDAKVKEQLEQVRMRIRDLEGLKVELERLTVCCQGGVIEQCRIIESLSSRS